MLVHWVVSFLRPKKSARTSSALPQLAGPGAQGGQNAGLGRPGVILGRPGVALDDDSWAGAQRKWWSSFGSETKRRKQKRFDLLPLLGKSTYEVQYV